MSKPKALFTVVDTILNNINPYAIFINKSDSGHKYKWSFGDGHTSNDQNPWHEYTDSGKYDVQLIVISEYCGSDTLIVNNLIEYIDPKNNLGKPTYIKANILNINNFMSGSDIQIELYDITGKLIRKWGNLNHPFKLDLNPIIEPSAIYILVVFENNTPVLKSKVLKY